MKITNNLKYLILLVVSLIVGLTVLNVDAAPSSIKVKSKSSLYYFSGSTDYINGYIFIVRS